MKDPVKKAFYDWMGKKVKEIGVQPE